MNAGFYPENFNKGGWKTLEYFWKTLEKQGRPPLKNKNSSDLAHFEIKFVKRGFFFKNKKKVSKWTMCPKNLEMCPKNLPAAFGHQKFIAK